MTNKRLACRTIEDARCKGFDIITPNLVIFEMLPRNIILNKPLYVGMVCKIFRFP